MVAVAERRSKTVRILGVDPAASGPTGYGLVDSDGRACRLVDFGAFETRNKDLLDGFPARLRTIYELIVKLIAEFSPDSVAVESVFTALNMKTALKLAEVRGVVLLAAAQANVPVHSYSPREVKASVAGYGQATKQQIQLMVRAILGMSETPKPSDAADALAIALCHIYSEEARVRFATAVPRRVSATLPVPQKGRSRTSERTPSP